MNMKSLYNGGGNVPNMYSSNENAFLKMKGQRANAPYALGHGDVNPTIPRTTITGTKGMRGTKDFAL